MLSVVEALKAISAYPIPMRAIYTAAGKRDVDLDSEATAETMRGKTFALAKADLLMWLSTAPDISQGGQSFSFTDEQRRVFRNQAQALYAEFEPDGSAVQKPIYGYKGSRR